MRALRACRRRVAAEAAESPPGRPPQVLGPNRTAITPITAGELRVPGRAGKSVRSVAQRDRAGPVRGPAGPGPQEMPSRGRWRGGADKRARCAAQLRHRCTDQVEGGRTQLLPF